MNSPMNKKITLGLAICLCLAWLTALAAPPVTVNEADPNNAEQGTTNLDVRIKGRGFANGASVRFLLPNSETEDGGVVVNNVTVQDSKNLTANITVDDAATVDFRDIEVQNTSGRKGKGITLFSVKLKGGGSGDTTPPDPIQDFYVEHPTFSTSVDLRWISPGDDGMSGSVDHYILTKAAQPDLSACDGPGPYNFSNAQSVPPPPTSPANWIYDYPVTGLMSETCYAFELEAFDEAGNSSGPAYAAAATVAAPSVEGWVHETVPPDMYRMELSHDPNSNNDPVVLGSKHNSNTRFFRRLPDGTWTNSKILRGCCENFVDLAFNTADNHYGALFHGKRARPQFAEQQPNGDWDITEIVRDAAGFSNEALQYDNSGRAFMTYSLGWTPYLAKQNGSSLEIERPRLADGTYIPDGTYAYLRFHPDTGYPVLVYQDWDRVTVHIATFDGAAWSVEDVVLGTDPGFRIGLQAFDYDVSGDPVLLFNKELGVSYDYWAHMLRQDEFGNWDVANATLTDPTGLFNQNIANMVITSDGAIYVSGTNTTNQAKVGKFCEAGRGFSCTPTMDGDGQNAWIWEVVDEGIGQAGRSVAVDETTGAVSLIAAGSDPVGDFFNYYRCDPAGPSPICGTPAAP